jgi:hypothetical protein
VVDLERGRERDVLRELARRGVVYLADAATAASVGLATDPVRYKG